MGGRYRLRKLKSVEMININENGIKNCSVDDLPVKLDRHSAVNSKVGPIVCGRNAKSEGITQNCHRLSMSNGSWEPFYPLNITRSDFSMTAINDLLVVIGGFVRGSSSFEYINVLNGTKWIKSDMQFNIHHHCSTKINQTTILIAGGYWNREIGDKKVSRNNQILS